MKDKISELRENIEATLKREGNMSDRFKSDLKKKLKALDKGVVNK